MAHLKPLEIEAPEGCVCELVIGSSGNSRLKRINLRETTALELHPKLEEGGRALARALGKGTERQKNLNWDKMAWSIEGKKVCVFLLFAPQPFVS